MTLSRHETTQEGEGPIELNKKESLSFTFLFPVTMRIKNVEWANKGRRSKIENPNDSGNFTQWIEPLFKNEKSDSIVLENEQNVKLCDNALLLSTFVDSKTVFSLRFVLLKQQQLLRAQSKRWEMKSIILVELLKHHDQLSCCLFSKSHSTAKHHDKSFLCFSIGALNNKARHEAEFPFQRSKKKQSYKHHKSRS